MCACQHRNQCSLEFVLREQTLQRRVVQNNLEPVEQVEVGGEHGDGGCAAGLRECGIVAVCLECEGGRGAEERLGARVGGVHSTGQEFPGADLRRVCGAGVHANVDRL